MVFDQAELLRAARTLHCNHFQHWLLQELVRHFAADGGAMNFSFPDGYISAALVGFDIPALSRDYVESGPQHDTFTPSIRMQPDTAVCSNTYALGDWPAEASTWQAMLLRHNIHRQIGLSTTLPQGGFTVDLYLSRGEGSAPFTEDEVDGLTRTAPLLREALTMNQSCMLARLDQPTPDKAFAITDPAGWIQAATPEFGRVLARLATVTDDFGPPKLPTDWLHDEALGNRTLVRHGWLLHTETSDEGFKVWLLPLPESSPWRKLTARQHKVAFMFALGHSAKEIATLLDLRESTIRVHIKNVYTRLDISTRPQLRELLKLGDDLPEMSLIGR